MNAAALFLAAARVFADFDSGDAHFVVLESEGISLPVRSMHEFAQTSVCAPVPRVVC